MPEIHLDDTIAAVATPVGEGGIAVLRLSGPDCFKVLGKIFTPKTGSLETFPSHTIHYGSISEKGHKLDQALVSIFRAPHSYTGQDVIEVSSHGGLVVTQRILNLLISNGARHAEPGEFTKRAFLNGKIDLTQAEAVLDLIRAKSEKSLETAVRQLSGSLSQKFKALKDELMKMYAHMEAFLDFPEENLEIYEDKAFREKFSSALKELNGWIAGFKRGSLLREGAVVVIAGRPNVGKSSLFNALLSRDRALVSEHPGTTRDALEEAVEIGGIYMRLIDTAGLSKEMERAHPVDRLGIERTRKTLQDADCYLFTVEGSAPLEEADHSAYEEIIKEQKKENQKQVIVLVNKCDLPKRLESAALKKIVKDHPVIEISTKTKQGFEKLEQALAETFSKAEKESEQITRLRHKNALEGAREALARAEDAFTRQEPLELVIVDLKQTVDALRELVGEIYSEDLLDVIFSEFCIGK